MIPQSATPAIFSVWSVSKHETKAAPDNRLAAAESLLVGHGKHLLHFASFDRTLNQAAEAIGLLVLATEE